MKIKCRKAGWDGLWDGRAFPHIRRCLALAPPFLSTYRFESDFTFDFSWKTREKIYFLFLYSPPAAHL